MSIARPITAAGVTALLLLTAAAGCTADDPGTVGPPPPRASAPAADCAHAVAQQRDPGSTYQVVAGAVAVPAGDQVLQPAEQTPGVGPTRLFAKWGLLVRTGTTVELSLPPGWGERARIRWGDPGAEPASAVTVVSCTAGSGAGPWSVFTGGTWVAEPDCVPIHIRTATEQATVELSIGTPCGRPGG